MNKLQTAAEWVKHFWRKLQCFLGLHEWGRQTHYIDDRHSEENWVCDHCGRS